MAKTLDFWMYEIVGPALFMKLIVERESLGFTTHYGSMAELLGPQHATEQEKAMLLDPDHPLGKIWACIQRIKEMQHETIEKAKAITLENPPNAAAKPE